MTESSSIASDVAANLVQATNLAGRCGSRVKFDGETVWSPLARGADWSTENFKGADVGGQTPLCALCPLTTRRRHSDNLNNLVIASVSLGAERTFIMSPRLPSKSTPKKRQLSADEERSLQGRKNVRLTWVRLSRPLLPLLPLLRPASLVRACY